MSKAILFRNRNNEKIYPCPYMPVGSIYLSINSTNPSKYFGGTWEQIAKGRTLVGVDQNDTDFNVVKKTGGEKSHTLSINEMPSHNHDLVLSAGINIGIGNRVVMNSWQWNTNSQLINNTIMASGGGKAHNNLPPYFTCYIWCRTA